MGQRNLLYTSPMIDMEMEQQSHLHPEPCLTYGSITSFPQHNNGHAILPPPVNRTSFDSHHLPENHHSGFPYGITQYNSVEHHHPDLVIATTSNHCNTYMNPSSSARVFPVSLNHGPHDQLQYTSNHGSFEVSADSYGRNGHFMDGSFKRKNAEEIPGNFQYFYPSAGSSSSVSVPMSAPRPLESDISMMDSASFPLVMEGPPHRSLRNRVGAIGVDPVLAHNNNHLIQGNYAGQPLQTVSTTPWLDQQFCSNGSDIGTFSWNQAPGIPYLQGCINGGGVEAPNMGIQGYQVTASSRNPTTFVHPSVTPQGHHNIHHLPPAPIPPLRGHNMDFHSQVATTSRRLSSSSTSYTSVNPFQNGLEQPGPRFVGPAPPTGLRIYRPHRREVMFDSSARHRSFPHLRVLPEDGVAILDISEYHELGHSSDHHRDMRLDIDHMSYEELLALGEQIGSVGSGLSDDFVLNSLKTRVFISTKSSSHLVEAPCVDHELDFCVICQTEYKDEEKIGIVDCGHEYHVDCIKKWLIVKNTCPICKSTALATQGMES